MALKILTRGADGAPRPLINVRAEPPADSLRQTIQMVPDLLRDSQVLVRDIQTQLATGAKFELALASALRASGPGAPRRRAPRPPPPPPRAPPPPPPPPPPPFLFFFFFFFFFAPHPFRPRRQ